MKKILVTGGAGFLGSSLVKQFIELGHQVRVFDDFSRGATRRLESISSQIELVSGDIRNYNEVLEATKGVDAVAHLAFVNGTEFFYSKPQLVLEVGVKGAIHTIDAAIECGVKEYYLMSSSEVYQTPPQIPTDETAPLSVPDVLNPRFSYGGGKIISELLAINYARENFDRMVIVRPHNVYGYDMGNEHVVPQLINRIKDAIKQQPEGKIELTLQGDGTQTRSFVYIDDFTNGCARAFLDGEHLNIYHVGTEDEITILSLAQTIASCFDREIEFIPGKLTDGSTQRRCPCINKVKALGYQPQVSIQAGIHKVVEQGLN
jgi:nucleoside-diphosphate-sugar epimerase